MPAWYRCSTTPSSTTKQCASIVGSYLRSNVSSDASND